MKEKKIFNQASKEKFEEARIIGGNPNGIISYNQTPHPWAYSLYKKMRARFWVPSNIDITKDKINYSKLSPAEKRAYDLVLAQLIANDSIQTNQLMDKMNSYITSPAVNACLAVQASEECLIEGTEILTSQGFKDFRYLTTQDLVANYNEDGTIYFNHPKRVMNYDHNGPMIKFSQHNYEQIVTPNHRVVKRYPFYAGDRVREDRKGQIVIEEADITAVGNWILPVAGYHNYGNDIVFTPLDALAVAWQADGGLVNNQTTPTHRGYCYRYSFKRKDKIDRLQCLINLHGCEYTRTGPNERGYTHFYIWVDRPFDKNFDWINPIEKNSIWIFNFLQELMYWDGSNRGISRRGVQSLLFTNTNLNAINKVQTLATLAGSQTGIYAMDPNKPGFIGKNKITAYQLHIVLGKDHKAGRDMKKESINYYGKVYCCEVDTGMIVCRYKGNVFVTGNSNHSESYAVMAEDICKDTKRIYRMHEEVPELYKKNQAVENMFAGLYKEGEEPTKEDLLICFAANQILERLIFPGGFVIMHRIGDTMAGSNEMINEIQKDELSSHVELFKFIFRTCVEEEFNGVIPEHVKDTITDLITKMTEIEIEWITFASEGLMGFSERTIRIFVQNAANEICNNLKIPTIYPEEKDDPLNKLLRHNMRDGSVATRENFFTGNVTAYSKGSVKDDWE